MRKIPEELHPLWLGAVNADYEWRAVMCVMRRYSGYDGRQRELLKEHLDDQMFSLLLRFRHDGQSDIDAAFLCYCQRRLRKAADAWRKKKAHEFELYRTGNEESLGSFSTQNAPSNSEVMEWMDAVLTPEEARYLKMSVGLSGDGERTQREIAAEFGVKQQRVSDCIRAALKKLGDTV